MVLMQEWQDCCCVYRISFRHLNWIKCFHDWLWKKLIGHKCFIAHQFCFDSEQAAACAWSCYSAGVSHMFFFSFKKRGRANSNFIKVYKARMPYRYWFNVSMWNVSHAYVEHSIWCVRLSKNNVALWFFMSVSHADGSHPCLSRFIQPLKQNHKALHTLKLNLQQKGDKMIKNHKPLRMTINRPHDISNSDEEIFRENTEVACLGVKKWLKLKPGHRGRKHMQ